MAARNKNSISRSSKSPRITATERSCALGSRRFVDIEVSHPNRQYLDRSRPRRWWISRGRVVEVLGGIIGKTTSLSPSSPKRKTRWTSGFHRRRARARSAICKASWCGHGRFARLSAEFRGGSAADCGNTGALECPRRHRARFGRRFGHQTGTGRRDRRFNRGRTGAFDERGPAQIDCADFKSAHVLHFSRNQIREKSASCLATPRRPRAERPSSSTPASGATFAALAQSNRLTVSSRVIVHA